MPGKPRWKKLAAEAAQRRAELTRQIAALRKEDAAAQRIIEKVEKTAACREEYRRQQERTSPARNAGTKTESAKTKTPAPDEPARVIWWMCTQSGHPSLYTFVNSFRTGFRVFLCRTRRTPTKRRNVHGSRPVGRKERLLLHRTQLQRPRRQAGAEMAGYRAAGEGQQEKGGGYAAAGPSGLHAAGAEPVGRFEPGYAVQRLHALLAGDDPLLRCNPPLGRPTAST